MSTTCPLCEFNDEKTELISAPPNAIEVIVPNTVQTIYGAEKNHYAFAVAAETLESLLFETNSQLKTIQQYSFYKCSKLKSIDLSSCTQLESIEQFAFSHCSSATTVNFPTDNSLSSIGTIAFQYCSFKSFFIPKTITKLGSSMLTNNDNLNNITFAPDINLKDLPYNFISNTKSLEKFTVPKSVISLGSCFEGAKSILE